MDKLSEALALVATIDPDANTSGVFWTDNVDMQDFDEALFALLLGTGVTTGTYTLALYEDTTAGTGTGAQAISGKGAAGLTTGSNDKQSLIHLRATDLSQGYRYARGRLLLSGAGADAAVVAFGGRPRYHPASDYDLASVSEIVD